MKGVEDHPAIKKLKEALTQRPPAFSRWSLNAFPKIEVEMTDKR